MADTESAFTLQWMILSLRNVEYVTVLQAFGLILVTFFSVQFMVKQLTYARKKPLPPGPLNLPIIGAFLSVGFRDRHLAFFRLAKKYGPLLYMKLGGGDVLVANDAETAKLLLKAHDADFCGRPQHISGEYLGYGYLGLDFCPYNAHFRRVRKVINSEVLCQARINEMRVMRREELIRLVQAVAANGGGGKPFGIRSLLDDAVTDIICRMTFGRLYPASSKLVEAVRILKIVKRDAVEIEKRVNIAELIPQLATFDLQKIEVDTIAIANRFSDVFASIVHEHQNHPVKESETKDLIDYLLEYNEGGATFPEPAIKAVLNDLLFGGIDALALSVEWPIAELLRHPQNLAKVQKELDEKVGHEQTLEETDIENLPYLQAIVKETMRMYPLTQLTPPHLNEREVEVAGYRIPANCIVYVNLYGAAHDPAYWKDADEFQPERFLGSDISMSGTHFHMIPFSSGRRRCPAVLFSSLIVPHMLAVLLHAFEWRLPYNMTPKDVVMQGRHGAANDKEETLIVCAEARQAAGNYKI